MACGTYTECIVRLSQALKLLWNPTLGVDTRLLSVEGPNQNCMNFSNSAPGNIFKLLYEEMSHARIFTNHSLMLWALNEYENPLE
jgi:hypothetical protein